MSDIDSNMGQTSDKPFFSKLASGDFGLAKTYWIFGVLVGIAVNFIVSTAGAVGSLNIIYFVALLHTLYFFPLSFGTWRAADRYTGNKIWAILAKIAIILGVIALFVTWISLIALINLA